MAAAAQRLPQLRPGRTCPLSYRYSPRVFDREPDLAADIVYVVGGLYGNAEALARVLEMAAAEGAGVRLVFNGDFHWFDTDAEEFARIDAQVRQHAALRGNVETEAASDDASAGCGCAYPADVSDAEVARSNEILERLRETARAAPDIRDALARLPMHLVVRVGAARVGVVHGDAASLAGWGFAQDQLDKPSHGRWLESMFRESHVDIFASSHTCLPAMRRYAWDGARGVVANNGAAGMPNFARTRHGVVTRIATTPYAGPERLYGTEAAGAHVEALRIDYDHARWVESFLRQWPEASSAHASYFRRICDGPPFELARAMPA